MLQREKGLRNLTRLIKVNRQKSVPKPCVCLSRPKMETGER